MIQIRMTLVSTCSPNTQWVSNFGSALFLWQFLFSASTIEYPQALEVVEIYFGAATYDEIEKDVKVTLEAALGLIGGTMGLLTGFSILSGVEIIFYVIKFLWKLRRKQP